jgi:DNA-binding XRE family transcriptional regulator
MQLIIVLLPVQTLSQMAERINRIKEILVIQGKTQVWLAEKIGKSKTAMSAICSNQSQPHLKELKKIAAILDVDIKDLLVSTK